MDEQLKRIFEKQGYTVVGKHSAVKHCHWVRKSLLFNIPCYKQTFYGIESHRCLQMTPAANQCTQKCLFCWRYQGFTEVKIDEKDADDPEFIFEKSLEAHRQQVSGFKGDDRCDKKKWEEARNPKHVACSLTGEPTLYPFLSEFFEICHRHGMTTFLVTNGTMPEVLENMDTLPTQLYVSLSAPNEEIYKKLNCPLIKQGWKRLNRTLEILPSLDTRTVIRHTLVDGWNLGYEEEYAKLDGKAEPWFIEPKGYVHVGYSRERLNTENMPRHEKIRNFGKKLASLTGYEFLDEREDSRVVLLGRRKERMI
ncbi:MAG: 4-demethylwyosine synthase TYW1 [Thermoplasmata archaeon]|nr:4-demethylwyosine synthase TYW1 [Thermoplasmata archaeon]HHH78335.1 4-demethylwyosine synthase TYW1 [Thermoplasmatales archaeon]